MAINPRVIVSDMDETLVNITPKWIKLIAENIDAYSDVMIKPSDKALELLIKYPESILLRDKYPLTDFFRMREDLVDVEQSKKELNDRFLELLSDEDFYLDIPLNPFGVGSAMAIATKDKVDKFIILTHSPNDIMDKAKVKFVEKHFNDPKVELVPLRFNEKKSDYLNSIEFGTFADDSFSVIMDVLENDKESGHEIIVPNFIYNLKPTIEHFDKIKEITRDKNIDLHRLNKAMPDSMKDNLEKFLLEMGYTQEQLSQPKANVPEGVQL